MKLMSTMTASLLAALACFANPPVGPGALNAASEANGLLAGPTISFVPVGGAAQIVFKGTLQTAEAVTGPWNDLPAATSPYQPATTASPRFYRARTPDSIFASTSVVAFTLTGPFQAHFDLAYAGVPDGIFPPVRETPYFDAALELPGSLIPVTVRVRGNSSLQECPFPKLKFKVSREEREGTPFADAREVKIGTHCAEGGRGTIGRLREQIAAVREALAYETMAELGFLSPRVRRALIEYRDTTPTNANAQTGWVITRSALILDDLEVVGERLGGRALEDEEVAALTNANFEAQLITDLQFLHALLGNWDYRLSIDGVGLWNTDVIERADGTLVPVAGDFDLASWVTGLVRFRGPPDYHPELPDADRQARYELDQIRQQVSRDSFAAARNRFAAQRSAIESRINGALIDEPGRTNCLRHVTAFFEAVEIVAR